MDTLTAVFVTSGLWGALVVFLLWLSHQERADLYSRLMARDLTDYKAATRRNGEPIRAGHPIRRMVENARRLDDE